MWHQRPGRARLHGIATIATAASLASAALALPATAQAQTYPTRPVTFVVPFAPGGSTDVAARAIAEGMGRVLKQTFVVDNKAGASGTIGTEFVARAAPDGYTMGAIGQSSSILPQIMGPVPRYKVDDLTYVGQMSFVEFILIGRKNLEANNIRELIALAKARPGKLSYGESGTAVQLAAELLKTMTGTNIVRVPYKGDTPAVADVAGGHIELGMVSLAGALGQVKAGAVKALGVGSKTRSKALPDVPVIAETVPGYESGVRTMLAVPKATPRAIVDRLSGALNEVLADAALVDRFATMGLGVSRFSVAETDAIMKADYATLAKVVKDANIPMQQ